jgi:regulator of protease activity HflC (stomatin/prohibitin superfamily)
MIRSALVLAAVLVLAGACDNARDAQDKATAAQREANAKIATASQEASQKSAAAQADADKKIADAQANFTRLREDYRHTTTQNLIDLDHKIDLLEARAKQSTGKAKTDLDDKLKVIRAQRLAFNERFAALDKASALTWDDTKAQLNQRWTSLKDLVASAT